MLLALQCGAHMAPGRWLAGQPLPVRRPARRAPCRRGHARRSARPSGTVEGGWLAYMSHSTQQLTCTPWPLRQLLAQGARSGNGEDMSCKTCFLSCGDNSAPISARGRVMRHKRWRSLPCTRASCAMHPGARSHCLQGLAGWHPAALPAAGGAPREARPPAARPARAHSPPPACLARPPAPA